MQTIGSYLQASEGLFVGFLAAVRDNAHGELLKKKPKSIVQHPVALAVASDGPMGNAGFWPIGRGRGLIGVLLVSMVCGI